MWPARILFIVLGLQLSQALESLNKQEKLTVNRSQKRPNFVILFADDIGYGDLGANRESPAESDTPFMDQLASKGTRFTDFHAGASVCTPSRAALLTGRLGKRTGVVKNFSLGSEGGLPLNETTFAETFKAAGYQTGMIGKWHLGHTGPFLPSNRGFDSYYGIIASADMGCADDPGYNVPTCPKCSNGSIQDSHPDCVNQVGVPLYENSTIVEQPSNLVTLASRYVQHARDFIKKSVNDASPFVLYVAFAHTHVPLQTDPKFSNLSCRGPFGDVLRELDNTVAGIMTSIQDAGIETDTLVWFTGDNGPWAVKCQYAGDSGPFLGLWQKQKGGGGSTAKQTVWEAGHREPTFVYWPGHVPAGRVSDSLLSALDIYPTIASIAGIPLPKYRSYDGMDISQVLYGKSLYNRMLFHPTNVRLAPQGEFDAIRSGSYKAVYRTGGAQQCGGLEGPILSHNPPLLFNVRKDPQESIPLDTSNRQYSDVLAGIEASRKLFDKDLRRDNTTVADYRSSKKFLPCCNSKDVQCRCTWQ
ncbi:arylsulfatase G-like [Asterias rubens]|uniref:arylsulfatase G-like n=1 Tax=Asterias rubens TaxID=7604 RepID=UPI00145510CA|nr:arylsulfatase G-like [Asterias rubens]XP_033630016.1 arylsulfatase G-like [Asterias rubens]XP_033630017.1 arylsulfatase G-like [Asterias rubens]